MKLTISNDAEMMRPGRIQWRRQERFLDKGGGGYHVSGSVLGLGDNYIW